MINEEIFGFKKTSIDKWYLLINLDRTRSNKNAEFYKRIDKEVKELCEDIQEQIAEEKEEGAEENAGL